MTPRYAADIAELLETWAGRYVLCGYRGDRKAAYPGWQNPIAETEIMAHARHSLVGLIPASAGYTVVDVDVGNPLDLALFLRPAFLTNSGTEGRAHLWFLDDEPQPRGNSKWTMGQHSGEIRGGNGYVVLWEPRVLIDQISFCPGERDRGFSEVAPLLLAPPPPVQHPQVSLF